MYLQIISCSLSSSLSSLLFLDLVDHPILLDVSAVPADHIVFIIIIIMCWLFVDLADHTLLDVLDVPADDIVFIIIITAFAITDVIC